MTLILNLLWPIYINYSAVQRVHLQFLLCFAFACPVSPLASSFCDGGGGGRTLVDFFSEFHCTLKDLLFLLFCFFFLFTSFLTRLKLPVCLSDHRT